MDRDTFIHTAKAQMHLALTSFALGDNGMAVLHAGIGDEHLLKAALAHRHPSLIVEPRDVSGLLHAAGLSVSAPSPVTSAKTIGAAEAFKRARLVMELPVSDKEHDTLLRARNGMAHMAQHADEETIAALATAVAVADAILGDLGAESGRVLGRVRMVAYGSGRAARRRGAKAAAGRGIGAYRPGGAGPGLRHGERRRPCQDQVRGETLRGSAWDRGHDGRDGCSRCRARRRCRPGLGQHQAVGTGDLQPDVGVLPCMVCKHPHAILRGSGGGGTPRPSYYETVRNPEMYDCPACSLELDGFMELLLVGLHFPFDQADYPL